MRTHHERGTRDIIGDAKLFAHYVERGHEVILHDDRQRPEYGEQAYDQKYITAARNPFGHSLVVGGLHVVVALNPRLPSCSTATVTCVTVMRASAVQDPAIASTQNSEG